MNVSADKTKRPRKFEEISHLLTLLPESRGSQIDSIPSTNEAEREREGASKVLITTLWPTYVRLRVCLCVCVRSVATMTTIWGLVQRCPLRTDKNQRELEGMRRRSHGRQVRMSRGGGNFTCFGVKFTCSIVKTHKLHSTTTIFMIHTFRTDDRMTKPRQS